MRSAYLLFHLILYYCLMELKTNSLDSLFLWIITVYFQLFDGFTVSCDHSVILFVCQSVAVYCREISYLAGLTCIQFTRSVDE